MRFSFSLNACTRNNGFTLVELLSAMAIIAILGAIAIPGYGAYITRARVARAIAEVRMISREITVHDVEHGRLPDTLADIGLGDLMDPWGRPYQYLNIEDGGVKGKGKLRRDRFLNPLNTDYDLYSMGVDGKTKTNLNAQESMDDVVRVMNGSYVGLASDF